VGDDDTGTEEQEQERKRLWDVTVSETKQVEADTEEDAREAAGVKDGDNAIVRLVFDPEADEAAHQGIQN
jgi:hypothetical protein